MGNTIVITQPTFLPYSGFFAPMLLAEKIIILDDVQFDKRSWQQRNRIKNNNGEFLLTIGVKSKGKIHQKINEVVINHDTKDIDKIIKSIYLNYKKAPFFDKYFDIIEKTIFKNNKKLIDLNLSLIKKINEFLDISNDKLLLSSSLKNSKKKFELIREIYSKVGATRLLSTQGTKNYFPKKLPPDMNINFYSYEEEIKYKQQHKGFIKNLSIIDILFNCGPESKNIIKKNLKLSN